MVALMSKKKQTMKNEFILKVALMSAPHFEGPCIFLFFFFCEFAAVTNIEEEKAQSWWRAGPQSWMQPEQRWSPTHPQADTECALTIVTD